MFVSFFLYLLLILGIVAIKPANYKWGGLLFLDHRRFLTENCSDHFKTKKPPTPKPIWYNNLASLCPAKFDVSACVVRTYDDF
jgi:hypothetical protein